MVNGFASFGCGGVALGSCGQISFTRLRWPRWAHRAITVGGTGVATRLRVPATSHPPSGVRSRPLMNDQPPANAFQTAALLTFKVKFVAGELADAK